VQKTLRKSYALIILYNKEIMMSIKQENLITNQDDKSYYVLS